MKQRDDRVSLAVFVGGAVGAYVMTALAFAVLAAIAVSSPFALVAVVLIAIGLSGQKPYVPPVAQKREKPAVCLPRYGLPGEPPDTREWRPLRKR